MSDVLLKNRLKEYRKKADLTQSQLAVLCRVSKNTISSIETCQSCPSACLAYSLCLVLECKFEDLFYYEVKVGGGLNYVIF